MSMQDKSDRKPSLCISFSISLSYFTVFGSGLCMSCMNCVLVAKSLVYWKLFRHYGQLTIWIMYFFKIYYIMATTSSFVMFQSKIITFLCCCWRSFFFLQAAMPCLLHSKWLIYICICIYRLCNFLFVRFVFLGISMWHKEEKTVAVR